MKVVKRKLNGVIVYRSSPEFEKGFGIKNAVALEGGLPEDYEEVEFAIVPISAVVQTDEVYEFRITAGGASFDTYFYTPQWTIGEAVPDIPDSEFFLFF